MEAKSGEIRCSAKQPPASIPLPQGLAVGSTVCLAGVPVGGAALWESRFALNLNAADDINLHFSARLTNRKTVLNSFRGGEWGSEEEVRETGRYPFARNVPVSVRVKVMADGFLVTVGGGRYAEFPHRLPPEGIDSVSVIGNMNITKFSVIPPNDA